MKFVIGGASGFLGTALVKRLESDGHQVIQLVRRPAKNEHESQWDPANSVVDLSVIESADVVVGLSGAPIAHWPWTRSYRRELLDSRVQSTKTLAEAIAQVNPAVTFLSGSAMAHYGRDRGDEILTESSSAGTGFLATIVHKWEEAAQAAHDAGARVVFLRTSNVVHRGGGLLGPLLLPFKLGLGARLGSGNQYFSLISLTDWVNAVIFLATNTASSGAYNLSAPDTQTNAAFTKAMGRELHRPAVLVVPSFAITTVAGDLGREILGSLRLEPAHLEADGFEFTHPRLEQIIAAALRD